MNVSEVMTYDVITVRPDTTVDQIAHHLTAHRINAVPVVNDEQQLLGVVSERELFLKEKGIPFSLVRAPALFREWVDLTRLDEVYAMSRHHTAQDVMNTSVPFVHPDDDIGHAAKVMLKYDIRSLPVLRDGVLEGVIARSDILGLLAKSE